MGAASRKKRERHNDGALRTSKRAQRTLEADRLNRLLASSDASPADTLSAQVRSAPVPHDLHELEHVNGALSNCGWDLSVNGWDDIIWTSPQAREDIRWEHLQDAGGWHELTITTDVLYRRPAYLLTLPRTTSSGPHQQRFFSSAQTVLEAVELLEAHTWGDNDDEFWAALGERVTGAVPPRCEQIVLITPGAGTPYQARP